MKNDPSNNTINDRINLEKEVFKSNSDDPSKKFISFYRSQDGLKINENNGKFYKDFKNFLEKL